MSFKDAPIKRELRTEENGLDLQSPQGKDAEVVHDYEHVLNLIGFGKSQWIILFTAGLLLMMVINETMGMSIITIASQCDFHTDAMDKVVMSGASFIGILCSSYFMGYLSDNVGRRKTLLYSTFLGNIFSFISSFIPNYWVFVVLRFIVGIAIAGASSTTYAFVGEFLTQRHRPVVINYASMFVGISMSYVPAVSWGLLSMDWSLPISETFAFRPWRLLNIFNLLPGFIAGLILLVVPESPKILMALHRDAEALDAVNWISLRNTGRSLADLKVYKMKSADNEGSENILLTTKTGLDILKKMWSETRPLFHRPHVWNFLISCTIMSGLFLSSNGMGLWFPEIENRVYSNTDENFSSVCAIIETSIVALAAQAANSTDEVCDDSIKPQSYIYSIILGLSYVLGYIIVGAVIVPLGRKCVLVGALVISSICGYSLLWLIQPSAMVVSFCLYLLLPGLCVSMLSGALVDLVPTHLRGKATCICLMVGRSGSVIGSNIIGALLETYCQVTFGLFSSIVLFCALLALTLPL